MRLNKLSPAKGSKKVPKRLGRGIGSGLGKTCGKGHKGQTARSGYSRKIGFEGGQMPLQRRSPKYGFTSRSSKFKQEIRLSSLENLLGIDVINLAVLHEKRLISELVKMVKVIKDVDTLSMPLVISEMKVTAGAKEVIEAAGGRVE